ncbi:uncharacterized protein AMSG_04980 [Thecamonas trahens ATCC 50062]|uniref:Uncharacterized protein n=1 Tax=Thecamonas trahens ATCC 50062 TaxID=461836 RepID=A0A0L0D8G5_THETB|nr:hypothetical protein AMSG_04980 [Thecamonas trahens ATCC 50062]KNC48535.1 hypothetical protein AMSG_04980 [Thecamonas trahens ATCC 50062]|eukprot:XP_013758642.1 hypothetical protein AMSG_04980 [Thecamonas trahens ATCC 50062]
MACGEEEMTDVCGTLHGFLSRHELLLGITAMWNGRMAEAETVFASAADTDPRAAYHWAECSALTAFLTEDPDDLAAAFARLDAAAATASATAAATSPPSKIKRMLGLGSSPPPPLQTSSAAAASPDQLAAAALVARVIYAEVGLIYGFLHLRAGSYVKGSYRLRKAWKAFSALVRELAPCAASLDPYITSSIALGSGMFLFFISLTPPKFLWLVSFVGFEADRERGLDSLRSAMLDPRGQRAPMALLFLIWVEMFFCERLDDAEALVTAALDVYPHGMLFAYLRGYMFRKRGALDAAAADFDAVIAASRRELPQLALAAMYERGSVLYMAERWADAAAVLSDFVDANRAPSFQAYATLELAYARHFAGESPHDIAPLLDDMPSRVRKHYTFDQFAARKAAEYAANNGISPTESCLIQAFNRNDASNPTGALELLATLASPDASTPVAAGLDEHALALLDLCDDDDVGGTVTTLPPNSPPPLCGMFHYAAGKAHAALGARRLALVHLLAVDALEHELGHEFFLLPHALTEVGDILMALNAVDDARRVLARAKSFSEYDFDKPLIRRITRMLDILSGTSTPSSRTPLPDTAAWTSYLDSLSAA